MKYVPLVVLVGRMNVGKSTLFNRLSSAVKSLIFDHPGTTRDVVRDTVSWNNRMFELVDTGGLSLQTKKVSPLQAKVHEKAYEALENADIVLLVVDGSVGLLPEDRVIANRIHELGKKMIIVVNKSDVAITAEHLHEFQAYGGIAHVAISAEHGKGINDLLDAVINGLPARGSQHKDEPSYRVMLLGRPNVGKSSLMNALVHYERSIVFDEPGTTREAISEKIAFDKEHLLLTDTPGLRRKSTIGEDLERSMVHSALQALEATDVVMLLIDGGQGEFVDQELKLAFYAFTERYKALIIIINKSDLMTDDKKRALDEIFARYPQLMKKVPLLTVSCVTEKNTGKVLPLVKKIGGRYKQTLPPEEVSQLFSQALTKKPLFRNQQKLIIYEIRQLATSPITLGLAVNEPAWFGPSQLAFFENLLRKEYDLIGVPVKFIVRKKLSRK
jgi:GTP-binding protein